MPVAPMVAPLPETTRLPVPVAPLSKNRPPAAIVSGPLPIWPEALTAEAATVTLPPELTVRPAAPT